MFNLNQLLKKIYNNELNEIDLSHEICPDYSKTPFKTELYLSDSPTHSQMNPWQIITSLNNYCFACSSGREITIWDSYSRECVNKISSDTAIPCMLGLPDGRLLTVHCQEHVIRIWRPETGECLGILHIGDDQNNDIQSDLPVKHMLLLPDNRLITGGNDNKIRIWDMNSGESMKSIILGKCKGISHLDCNNKSNFITVDHDNNLVVWGFNKKKQLSFHLDFLDWSLVLDSYDRLIFGSSNGYIYVLEPPYYQCKVSLKICQNTIYALKRLPDDNILAGSDKGLLCLIDIAKGQILQVFYLNPNMIINNIEVLADGRLIIDDTDGNLTLLNFPHRTLSAEDIRPILLALVNNLSVSTINLDNIVLDNNNLDMLNYLCSVREDLKIIGVPDLHNAAFKAQQ